MAKRGIWQRLFGKRIKDQSGVAMTTEDFLNGVDVPTIHTSPMNLSGVYQCIEIISNTIAKLPFFVMQRDSKEHIDIPELYHLLNEKPNRYMAAMTFKKLHIKNLLTSGNAYIYPIWKGGKVSELRIISPDDVSTYYKNGDVMFTFNLDDVEHKVWDSEIIHNMAFTLDGIIGISPLTYARLVTDVGLNQEEFQKSFYSNGGRPSGILSVASDLSTKVVKIGDKDVRMRDFVLSEWNKVGMGAGNAYKTALLDNGVTYKEVAQISPADMDFVNSKTENLEDIARFFNVPSYKLGVGKQTYSNNEQAQRDFITNTIVPLVTQIEQELTEKLLTESQRRKGYQIKANIESELRGDTATRAAWYDKMRSMGVYNINEIRALENLPSIGEDGETRLIGANSVPLEKLLAGETAGSATPNPLDPSKEETEPEQEQPKEEEQNDDEQ